MHALGVKSMYIKMHMKTITELAVVGQVAEFDTFSEVNINIFPPKFCVAVASAAVLFVRSKEDE